MQLQNNRTPEQHMAELMKIKDQTGCFNSSEDNHRYVELKKMKDYLEYRLRLREYEASLAAANGTAEEMRSNYVRKKLEKFDNAVLLRAEQDKWGWSPLYSIFKEWPLSNFPKSPWSHTQEEWAALEQTLLASVSTEALSLEVQCPHIVRAFLVLFRTLHGHTRPLPHPKVGLTFDYILACAVDQDKSVALTNVVHNLATMGWAIFPGIQNAAESFSTLHSDTVALLGYDTNKQVAVVEKIRAFLGRVAHRAVADMIRMQRDVQLEDMWFAAEVPDQRRTKCNEVQRAVLHV